MSIDPLEQAIALIEQDKLSEAQKILEQLLSVDRHNLPAWYNYARTYPAGEKRIKALELCLEYNPDNIDVKQTLKSLRSVSYQRPREDLAVTKIIHKKNRVWILIPILLICGLLVTLSSWFFVTLKMDDETLAKSADETLPKLAALNQKIFSQLPPPPGVQQTKQFEQNQNEGHDFYTGFPYHYYQATLFTQYKLIETTPDEITAYYKNLLLSQHWQQIWYQGDTEGDGLVRYEFQSGTACLGIVLNVKDFNFNTGYFASYGLRIWHDFWSQDFSPPRPTGFVKYLKWDDTYWPSHCPPTYHN